jgi:glutamyl-tRNA reductase
VERFSLLLCEWARFYRHTGTEAIRHVFRVTSSLDSMVVGEPEIVGQVKDALVTAREAGTVGRHLDALLSKAFSVSKRIRTETAIGSAAVSVPYAAVELAKKIFGKLHGKTVMILGAGKMGELAARYLVRDGASTVLVANRTYERAVELASELGGLAVRYDDRWTYLTQADILVSSTGCPHFLITRQDGERLHSARQGRPMFFIDIAVPRDIDPAINGIAGFFLYDIDDLEQVVKQNVRERERAAAAAEKIVAREAEQFRKHLVGERVVPTIVQLRHHLDEIRRAELARYRSELGPLTREQEQAIEILTTTIINKILHTSVKELKAAEDARAQDDVVGMVRRLFPLDEEKKPALAVPAVPPCGTD